MNRTLPLLLAAAAVFTACGNEDPPPCKYASYKTLSADPVKVCQTELNREKGVCFDTAQVCPNLTVMNYCFQGIGNEYPPITLQLTNYGRAPLTISKVELLGDDHCSFRQPLQTNPPLGTAIKSGDSMVVEVFYDPTDAGQQDFTQLRILSDAENFPELIIGACGTGIAPDDHAEHACGPGKPGEADGFLCQAPANTTKVDCP